MALADLEALNVLAFAEHGKSGELPCKYNSTVGAGLDTNLTGHTPTEDLHKAGTLLWRLTQSGAKKVWRTLRPALGP